MLSRHTDWSSLRFRTCCVTGHYWLWLLFAHYFPPESILAILCLYVCLSRTPFPYVHMPKYYWVPLTSAHLCLLSSSTKVSQTLPRRWVATLARVCYTNHLSARVYYISLSLLDCVQLEGKQRILLCQFFSFQNAWGMHTTERIYALQVAENHSQKVSHIKC